jgi:hypothetical protein
VAQLISTSLIERLTEHPASPRQLATGQAEEVPLDGSES